MNRLRFLWVSVLWSLLLLTPQTANAGWTRTYGGPQGDGVSDLQPALDGGYILVSPTASFSSDTLTGDIWLLKLNSEGDTLWTRTYGGPLTDAGLSIEQTLDSGYIIAGVKDYAYLPVETGDLWLLKADSLGDTLWTRTYGGDSIDEGEYVHQNSDGGYIIIGTTGSFGAGGKDIWVLKTDASGDTLWTRTHGGEEDDWCISAQHLSGDQGYIILGYFRSFGGFCLMRIDEDGDSLWMRPDSVWSGLYIEEAVLGGCILTGSGYGPNHDPNNLFDLWLSLSDPWGDTIWTRAYGGEEGEQGNCVKPTSDGGYIITGYTTEEMSFGMTDVLLLKTDGEGNALWTRTYGGDSIDEGIRVLQTSDTGYLIAGITECFGAGGFDIWLIKTDSLGYVDVKEESHTQVNGDWEVVTSIGPQIVLRYMDHPDGFHASIYDATGRKVDELNSSNASGTITWGKGVSRGVYFIREESGYRRTPRKVILVQ